MIKFKRMISLVLIVMMLCSLVIPEALAFTAQDPANTFQLTGATVELDGSSDKEVQVVFSTKATDTYTGVQGNFEPEPANGITLTNMTGFYVASGTNVYSLDGETKGLFVYADDTNFTGIEVEAEGALITATYSVDANTAAGTYPVTLELEESMDASFNTSGSHTFTADIVVTRAAETPDTPVEGDYSIYYVLNETAQDTDTDGYFEYNHGETVTADVYIQSKANIELQAYDIYFTYGAELKYTKAEFASGVAYLDGETLSHIQMVGKNTTAIALAANTAQKLGTVSFTVLDTAVYDEGIDLTIVTGESGEDVTNISVATDTDSYYPVAADNGYKGVEVLTTYDVVYNDNVDGAEITVPDTQKKQHNVGLLLSATEPTRSGYTFNGWNTASDGTGTPYAAGDTYSENAAITLYAQWSQNKHTVSWYNADGTQIYTEQVAEGESAVYNETTYGVPQKTGVGYDYTFIGWNTEPDMDEALDTITVTGAMNLYPVFSKMIHTWPLTFNDYDGTLIHQYTFYYSEKVTDQGIEKPNRPGYTFAGWSPALPAYMPDNALTVTATYTPNEIKVTLKYEDGTTANVTQNVTFDGTYGSLIPTTNPEREGYTFVQWVDESNNPITADTKVTNSEAHEIKAVWKEHTYNVTFHPNGGQGEEITNTYTYSQQWTILAADTFTKADYVFTGWNTKEDGTGTPYTPNANVSMLTAEDGGVITLYAQWDKDVYTITYQANLDTVENIQYPATTSFSATDGANIPGLTNFEYGYEFQGWTCEELGISNAQQSINIPAGTEENVTLVANFKAIEYTITFKNENEIHHTIIAGYETTIEYTELTEPTKEGYKFDGWDADLPNTMPADGKIINAVWAVNQYTIKFMDTDGTVIETLTQDYGSAINAPSIPEKVGFTNDGWDTKVPATMPVIDGEMTITAKRIEHTYTVKFNTDGGTPELNAMENVKYTDALDMTNANAITKPGYELTGWSDGTKTYLVTEEISKLTAVNGGEVTLTAQWKAATYTLTFNKGDHHADNTELSTIEVTYGQPYPDLPDVTPAVGYTKNAGWYIDDTTVIQSGDTVAITADTTVTAKYTPITYTITLEANNGTLPEGTANPFNYTIENTFQLPEPSKANSQFKAWKVTVVDGNWTESEYNAKTNMNGYYGNVTLTAQWEVAVTLAVEEYGYVDSTQYTLLRVADNLGGDTMTYQFDGVTMYWTNDPNYLIETTDTGVFYTLVNSAYVTNGTLNDEGLAKLTTAEAAREMISYDGEINGDNFLNVADANIVYQMIQNKATYYSMEQLTIEQRLAADVYSDDATGSQHRATIADVNAIVNIINGTTN